MNKIVYNIPTSLVGAYNHQPIIVRTSDPSEWVRSLPDDMLDQLVYLQLLSISSNLEPLMHWGEGIAVELVIQDPASEFAALYDCTKLLDRHPVWVSIPLIRGFEPAVKLAVSLQFAARLRVMQPDSLPVDALNHVLDFYLHHGTASEPIDFIHSLFFAFLNEEPVTLWEIQEEDSAQYRFIDDQGKEHLPGRLAQAEFEGDKTLFLDAFKKLVLKSNSECSGCTFFENCAGYFKWPNPGYRCDGVKPLLRMLRDAASELRSDLNRYDKLTAADPQ